MKLLSVSVFAFALLVVAVAACAQSPTSPSPQESSSRTAPDVPTPPDAPVPDLGQQTSPPPKSKVKKVASKFDPHCIDVIFHACWSSPTAAPSKVPTEEEQKAEQATKDIDVGFYYLNEKNYVAAESRLKEAVALKPDAAAAYIGLGQAQQKLRKDEDARRSYEAYLKLDPEGADAAKVKKALEELK